LEEVLPVLRQRVKLLREDFQYYYLIMHILGAKLVAGVFL
jgi:hypothetical protein